MAATGPSVVSEVKKCCPIPLCTFMNGAEKEVLHHVASKVWLHGLPSFMTRVTSL